MKSLLLTLLLLSSVVSADELVVNIKSYHINAVGTYNENNYGLGYHDTSKNIEYGVFRNSYYKTESRYSNGIGHSIYIKGSAWEKLINKYIALNVDVGIIIYGKDGKIPLVPMIQPMVIFKPVKNININVGYMPLIITDDHNTTITAATVNQDNTTTIATSTTTEKSIIYGVLTLSTSYSF